MGSYGDQYRAPETFQPKKSEPITINGCKSRYPFPKKNMTEDEKFKYLITKSHDQLVSIFLLLEDGYPKEMQELKIKIQNIIRADLKAFQDRVTRALAAVEH